MSKNLDKVEVSKFISNYLTIKPEKCVFEPTSYLNTYRAKLDDRYEITINRGKLDTRISIVEIETSRGVLADMKTTTMILEVFKTWYERNLKE